MDPRRRRLRQLGWLVLLGVAGAIRVYAWRQTAVLFNDGPIFLAMAEAISEGRFAEVLDHPYHPLYPAAIAAVFLSTPLGLEAAAVSVSILGGLMSVIALMLLVRQQFDEELGWMAGITLALHPWAVDFSSDVMSDGLYAGLFLLGFLAMASMVERPSLRTALACGGLAGLAYLTRPEGVGLVVAGAFLLVMRVLWRRRRSSDGPSIGVALVGLVLSAALVMTPLVMALNAGSDDWRLTRKKGVASLAAGQSGVAPRPPSSGGPTATIPLPRSSERIDRASYDRPPRTPLGLLEAASRAMRTSLAAFRYEVALFALVGLFGLRKRLRPLREATLFLPAILYSGVLILLVWGAGYVARRHALAALTPLIGYAVLGWRSVYRALVTHWFPGPSSGPAGRGQAGRLRRAPSPLVACLALLLVLSGVWGPRDLRRRRADRIPVRAAAEWLGSHAGAGQVIGAQKLRVAYYARGRHVPLPTGKNVSIEKSLRREGVAWLVIDEARLDDHRGLASGLGDWLHIVHVESGMGRRVLVLELR